MPGAPAYKGKKVDVVLRPEWAAVGGVDVSRTLVATDTGFGEFALDFWNVTAGKTLYITQVSFAAMASAVANADLPQVAELRLKDNTLGLWRLFLGGNGGAAVSLSKPLVFPSGDAVQFTLYGWANHDININGNIQGYEL